MKIDGPKDFFIIEIEYVVSLLVWIYERLYTLPITFMRDGIMVMLDHYKGLPMASIFRKEWVFCIEIGCLWILYGLHIYWFILLVRLGYRAFVSYGWGGRVMSREPENIRNISKEGYEGDSDVESDDESPKKNEYVCLLSNIFCQLS